jgi:hypothetical protein
VSSGHSQTRIDAGAIVGGVIELWLSHGVSVLGMMEIELHVIGLMSPGPSF